MVCLSRGLLLIRSLTKNSAPIVDNARGGTQTRLPCLGFCDGKDQTFYGFSTARAPIIGKSKLLNQSGVVNKKKMADQARHLPATLSEVKRTTRSLNMHSSDAARENFRDEQISGCVVARDTRGRNQIVQQHDG